MEYSEQTIEGYKESLALMHKLAFTSGDRTYRVQFGRLPTSFDNKQHSFNYEDIDFTNYNSDTILAMIVAYAKANGLEEYKIKCSIQSKETLHEENIFRVLFHDEKPIPMIKFGKK